MELTFVAAVGLALVSLALLGLPVAAVAKNAVRSHSSSITAERVGVSKTTSRPELETERSVCVRLYGESAYRRATTRRSRNVATS